jgi:RNA ligase
MRHPARAIHYDVLIEGLRLGVANRTIYEKIGPNGLRLFVYSEACVYNNGWDDFSMMARGLVLDTNNREVVATPFPKFFNHSESHARIPDLPFETFEKVDGSLIIVFWHNGEWCAVTKGSFYSEQARWAKEKLKEYDTKYLIPGNTYLFEAIYHANRIVIKYDTEELVLLGLYDASGFEYDSEMLSILADRLGCRMATQHEYNNLSALIAAAGNLIDKEGWVLRYQDGTRIKIKGDEYCRLHRVISGITPLNIWSMMFADDDLESVRKELPEEFLSDFDQIYQLLNSKIVHICQEVERVYAGIADLSDKEIGLKLASFPASIRSFIFPYRENDGDLLSGRSRRHLFNSIRPASNRLEGYNPSSSMSRVQEAV